MKISYWLIFFLSLLLCQYAIANNKLIPISEVQSHNTATNCWIIINNKVYDVTKFIKDHDTKCSKMKLSDFCGKDASAIWLEKENSGHAHKHRSVLKFESSQIGNVNPTLSPP